MTDASALNERVAGPVIVPVPEAVMENSVESDAGHVRALTTSSATSHEAFLFVMVQVAVWPGATTTPLHVLLDWVQPGRAPSMIEYVPAVTW